MLDSDNLLHDDNKTDKIKIMQETFKLIDTITSDDLTDTHE